MIRTPGHFEEDVKVIGHQAMGQYAHAAESFIEAHEVKKLLFYGITQDEPPVHDPRNAVVISNRSLGHSLESSLSHVRM